MKENNNIIIHNFSNQSNKIREEISNLETHEDLAAFILRNKDIMPVSFFAFSLDLHREGVDYSHALTIFKDDVTKQQTNQMIKMSVAQLKDTRETLVKGKVLQD